MKRYLCLAFAGLVLSGCASDGMLTPEALANREMCEELKRQLFQEREIRSFTVYPRCEPGRVTLNGTVPDFDSYDIAERIARGMPGVREVRNNLRITDEDAAIRPF